MLKVKSLIFLASIIGVSQAIVVVQKATSVDDSQYFNRNDYKTQTKAQKVSDLWTMISKDQTVASIKWDEWFTTFDDDMSEVFKTGDEMATDRVKLAHQQGIVANVTWVPTNYDQGYTGIMDSASGSTTNILMRLSETGMLHESSGGLMPSVAFKFLRDGVKSDNIVAMPSFSNSGTWDFFEKAMHTRVDPFDETEEQCENNTIRKKLVEGSDWAFSCGIVDVFRHYEDGTDVPDDDVKVPYELKFVPYDGENARSAPYTNSTESTWYDAVIESVKSGETIFQVMALTAPDVDSYVSTSGRTIEPNLGYEWVEIAQIVLESDLQTSLFADERLFFAHAKLQIDRTYWDDSWILPDKFTDPRDNDDDSQWLLGVPENTYWKPQNVDEGYSLFMEALEVGSGCPFQWLLDLVSESESTADDL